MTVIHEYEFQTTLDRNVNSAPEPTDEYEISHQEVALVFERMFDTIALALCDETHEFTYDTGDRIKGEPINKFPFYKMIPVYAPLPREDVIQSTRQDLAFYTKGTLSTGALELNISDFPEESLETYDTICEAYVEDGINRAIERYNQSQLNSEYPEHITTGEADAEANSKFANVLEAGFDGFKELGHAVVSALKNSTESIISRPIFITATHDKHIQEATPGHPASPKLMTGDNLTVTMETVKR